jgi:cytosine deaminase
VNVRPLRPEDAGGLVSLRREALETDPLAFGASVEDDRGLSPDLVRSSLSDDREQAIFGCFDADGLAGMVGVARLSRVKQRHTGLIWGMYVSPRARRKGAGRALLDAAVGQARGWGLDQVQLAVTEAAQTAKAMYEAAGFRSWGREPRALGWNGRFVDEHHLVLDLREAGPGTGQGPHVLDTFLRAAIEEAEQGLREGGIPIGSVLVHGGRIIGRGHNRRVQRGSAVLHGEMDALEHAGRLPAAVYRESVIYTTLSPCAMCTGAILLYGIPRVVVGENRAFLGEEALLRSRGVAVEIRQDAACIALMTAFIRDHPRLWNEDIGV